MKKVTNWFSKKKKQVISNGIDVDALPEAPRDIPRYIPKQSNLYSNFKSDDCCSANDSKTVTNVSNDTEMSKMEVNEEPLTIRNRTDLNLSTTQEPIDVVEQQLSINSVEEIPRLPDVRTAMNNDTPSISLANTLMMNSTDNMSRSSSLNNMAVQGADQMQDLPNDLISKKIHENKKNGGNTYVITISNSTHFHIGTQKTINYPGAEENGRKKEFTFPNITNGKLVELDENQMLDMKNKLSDDDLLQISLSVRERWQEFARNLGLEESTIHELEEMNDSEYNLIVYDVLHQYLEKYPNTTVGFMVNVLKKSNEFEAIRKLMDKR